MSSRCQTAPMRKRRTKTALMGMSMGGEGALLGLLVFKLESMDGGKAGWPGPCPD